MCVPRSTSSSTCGSNWYACALWLNHESRRFHQTSFSFRPDTRMTMSVHLPTRLSPRVLSFVGTCYLSRAPTSVPSVPACPPSLSPHLSLAVQRHTPHTTLIRATCAKHITLYIQLQRSATDCHISKPQPHHANPTQADATTSRAPPSTGCHSSWLAHLRLHPYQSSSSLPRHAERVSLARSHPLPHRCIHTAISQDSAA